MPTEMQVRREESTGCQVPQLGPAGQGGPGPGRSDNLGPGQGIRGHSYSGQ